MPATCTIYKAVPIKFPAIFATSRDAQCEAYPHQTASPTAYQSLILMCFCLANQLGQSAWFLHLTCISTHYTAGGLLNL